MTKTRALAKSEQFPLIHQAALNSALIFQEFASLNSIFCKNFAAIVDVLRLSNNPAGWNKRAGWIKIRAM